MAAEPRALSDAEYKVEQAEFAQQGRIREIFNRHGARLVGQTRAQSHFSARVLLPAQPVTCSLPPARFCKIADFRAVGQFGPL